MKLSLSTMVAAAVLMVNTVSAHTWIDCLDTDFNVLYNKDETPGKCRGYIKNYVGRGSTEIDVKSTIKTPMDAVAGGGTVCTPGDGNYVDWRHRLQVTPGQPFFFGYLGNGHVSKDESGRTTYYGTYWTGKPDSVLEKTTDLSTDKLIDGMFHNFDDTNCGESTNMNGQESGRAGTSMPCIGKLSIPKGTAPGIYTLVWYWQFYNTVNGAPKKITNDKGTFGGDAYASCYEVEVLAEGGRSLRSQ